MTNKRKRQRSSLRKDGKGRKQQVTNLLPSHLRPRAEAKSITLNLGIGESLADVKGEEVLDNIMQSYGSHSTGGSRKEKATNLSDVARAKARTSPEKKTRLEVAERLWDPLAKSTKTTQQQYFEKGKYVVSCSLAREVARRKVIRKLQAKLETLCVSVLGDATCQRLQLHTSVTLRNGNGMFERWLFNSLHGQDASNIDPLLPHRDCLSEAGTVLQREIQEAGADETDAERVTSTFTKFTTKLIRNFVVNQEQVMSHSRSKAGKNGKRDVVEIIYPTDSDSHKIKDKTRVTLRWLMNDSVDQVINLGHLKKLGELFSRHNGVPVERRDEMIQGRNQEFAKLVFTMLLRYDTFGGAGFQAALNNGTFDVLKKQFGVRHECFASPFNSRYEHFNSAFVDTDYYFGSCGSFFDFHPTRGSYEANPPFVPKIISKMTMHIDQLLSNTTNPLSFIVIVPDWSEHSGKANMGLIRSPFLKHHVKVANREHTYHEGAQHRRSREYRKSTCDTAVYFLQNPAGNEMWPPTLDSCNQLIQSFSGIVSTGKREEEDDDELDEGGAQERAVPEDETSDHSEVHE